MSAIDMNHILNRQEIVDEITNILSQFEAKCKDVNFKKGIYIYGSPGCGKTKFVVDLLNLLDYDVIKYDAGDVRNKSLIDTITSNNIASRNVLHMMSMKTKRLAIVMDEIDGMNNGDKGGITALIKLIRQKKTKKQRQENMTMNPIICIGNYYVDKKLKELMKVCNVFELKTPTTIQMTEILRNTLSTTISSNLEMRMVNYIQGDLRKYAFIQRIYEKNPALLQDEEIMRDIFHVKSYSDDSKKITQKLIQSPVPMSEHSRFMNETDRTIVALLWHENIVDAIANLPMEKSVPFYYKILENICFADFMDRITFQNQIWQFNEMSSLIKTFHNNRIYHDTFPEKRNGAYSTDIRFTKVLTKYSTEYNNILFVYNLCQQRDMDKKDLITFFQELRLTYGQDFYLQSDRLVNIERMFENTGVDKLDIKRMYRYLDKNVKRDVNLTDDDYIDDNDDVDVKE